MNLKSETGIPINRVREIVTMNNLRVGQIAHPVGMLQYKPASKYSGFRQNCLSRDCVMRDHWVQLFLRGKLVVYHAKLFEPNVACSLGNCLTIPEVPPIWRVAANFIILLLVVIMI